MREPHLKSTIFSFAAMLLVRSRVLFFSLRSVFAKLGQVKFVVAVMPLPVPRAHFLERGRLVKFLCLILLMLPLAEPAWAGLPSGWSDADIGGPGLAGSAAYTNGNWTVTGGGADIWGASDQFNYASTSMVGDGTMIGQVTSIQNSSSGDGWSKAGVMFRNDSTAGSVNVSIVATFGEGVSFQWRPTAGAQSQNSQKTGITVPVWLKLVRSAGTFTGSYSTNGSNWVQVSSQSVTMSNSVLAGLDVTAHNNSAQNTATITNVSVTPVAITNPVVVNQPASSVLPTSATLNGQISRPGIKRRR